MARASKSLLIILAVSLSVNLFFAGLLVGKKLQSGPVNSWDTAKDHYAQDRNQSRGEQFNVRRLLSAIPEDHRERIRPFLQENRDKVRNALQNHRRAQKQLFSAMTADPLDMDAVKARAEEEVKAKQTLEGFVRKIMQEILPTLELEERQFMVKQLMRRNFVGPPPGVREGRRGMGKDMREKDETGQKPPQEGESPENP